MTIWITADTHFGHGKIIEYCNRPFGSREIMDATLLEHWRSRVQPTDYVLHLGDVALFKRPKRLDRRRVGRAEARAYFTNCHRTLFCQLPGRKLLVPGNHDDADRMRKVGWALIGSKAVIELDGRRIVLCHYPRESWPGQAEGAVHLHGHSHGKSRPLAGRLDVGVDCHGYAPIKLADAVQLAATPPRLRLRAVEPDYAALVFGSRLDRPAHQRVVDDDAPAERQHFL